MNYDLPEVYELLGSLQERLKAKGKAGGDGFEIFVIPNAAPTEDLYADLASRGVTATMGSAWAYNDRDFSALEAKQNAIAEFGQRFIAG